MTTVIKNPVILTENDLRALSLEIKEDSIQPGKFRYVQNSIESNITYDTKDEATYAAILVANTLHQFSQCQNCGNIHSEDNLEVIKHYSMRVSPGEASPSGQCPDCGCLCHQV